MATSYTKFLQDNYKATEKIGLLKLSGGRAFNEILMAGTLMQSASGFEADCYMAMNPLAAKNKRVKRDKEHVGRLKWLYVDLDFYNTCYKNFTKQQIAGLLELDYFGRKIPAPSYIIDSGRGMYLLWKVEEHINAYPRWEKMQRFLCEQLQEFGADRKVASDSARVLRRIGSINSKTGTKVEVMEASGIKYSLTNLIRDYVIQDIPSEKMISYAKRLSKNLHIPMPGNSHSEVKEFIKANKDKTAPFAYRRQTQNTRKSGIKDEFSLISNRLKDLETLLIKFRDHENSGREFILFLYRYWQICITDSLEEGLRRTLELNSRLYHPLDQKEAVHATASAEKYYLKGKVFRCTNSYVIDALNITLDEMQHLKIFINSEEKKARKRIRNKKAYSEALKRKGKTAKEAQIRARRWKICRLLLKGKTVHEICRILKISRATFYADKQQAERYLTAQKKKQQKLAAQAEAGRGAADAFGTSEAECLKNSARVLTMSFRTSPCESPHEGLGCFSKDSASSGGLPPQSQRTEERAGYVCHAEEDLPSPEDFMDTKTSKIAVVVP